MGIYRNMCERVEDWWIQRITKPEERVDIVRKVASIRGEKRAREEEMRRQIEQQRLEQVARERAEVETLLKKVVDVTNLDYTDYEFNEVKRNRSFFTSVVQRVFEANEKGLTFIYCEFDKSSKREMKGYLLVTDKRVLFLTPSLNFMDKFLYRTIINVTWFQDGFLERGLRIQYGKRKLEFDEIFDAGQLKRVADLILNLSSNK